MVAQRLDKLDVFTCNYANDQLKCTTDKFSGFDFTIDPDKIEKDSQDVGGQLKTTLRAKENWNRIILCLEHSPQGVLFGLILYPKTDRSEAFLIKPSYRGEEVPTLISPPYSFPLKGNSDLEKCSYYFRE